MQGGPIGHGLNKNEFKLKMAQGSNDPTKLTTIVANFTFGSTFANCLLHLEREKVFGFAKQLVDCFLGIDQDSHRLDCVNFFHPWVFVPTPEPNIVDYVHVQQPPSGSSDCCLCYFEVA